MNNIYKVTRLIDSDQDEWYNLMKDILPDYEIDTDKRVAAFYAQCAHESANFSRLSENLNYSSDALERVFSKYFSKRGIDASDYHRQPEKIANLVYANRMGNSDSQSGDGWKYRGRGIIQLTGKYNYSRFAKYMGMDLDHVIKFLETQEGSLVSACWFWDEHDLNSYADEENIKAMTRVINGGYNGLEDRIRYYEKAYYAIQDSKDFSSTVVKKGSTGKQVVKIQKIIGAVPDGVFGNITERLVKVWQSDNGLIPDGIVGPATLEKMIDLYDL